MSKSSFSFVACAALLLGTTSLVLPQIAAAAVDEIVVTTRKRSESLQTVPLAISALTAQDLERGRIEGLADIASLTPGLAFQTIGNGSLATPTIRGLAQTNLGLSPVEKNVAVFLDDIYISASAALDIDMLDLERVEVVKGPQSALYGRNAFAGAINYVPAGAGDELSGDATATIGSDELYELKASVGGPIVEDKLGARVSVGWSEFDGTFENLSGDNLQGYEKLVATGVVEVTPTDNFSLDWFGYYSDKDVEQSAMHVIDNNCGTNGIGFSYFCGDVPFKDEPFDISPDSTGLEVETFLTSLRAELEFDQFKIVSVTGYMHNEETQFWDGDFSSGAVVPTCLITNFNPLSPAGCTSVDGSAVTNVYQGSDRELQDFSQELRFEYDGDSIDLLLGGFYYESELDYAPKAAFDNSGIAPGQVLFLPAPFQSLVVSDAQDINNAAEPFGVTEFDTETWSIFGSVTVDFTDRLTGAAELRYTHEDKSRFSYRNTPTGILPGAMLDETFNFVTPRFTLDFQANDDQLFYASIAKGVRAGGFNTPTGIPSETSYDQESNWTYEIGAKTNWLDDRLQVNAALFYVDWQDLQITSVSQSVLPAPAPILNVGEATSLGIEIEVNAKVTENFEVRAGYAYANPEFEDGIVDPGARTQCGIDMVAGSPTNICAFDGMGLPLVGGNQLGRSVEHMANFTAIYSAPLTGEWDWYARGDVSYTGEIPVRSINRQFVPDRTVTNARIGVERDNLELSLWAKNLFDEEYVSNALAEPRLDRGFQNLTSVVQGNGRTFGATAAFRF